METKYECPFCGSEDVAIGRLHNVTINNLSLKDHPAAMCRRCGTVGPMVQDESTALAAFCTPRHFAERVKAELVPVAVAKTEAERLRVAGVGDVVTLDDGRRVRVEIFELDKKCCELCVFSADDEACNAAPCLIGERPIHRDSVYFEEVCDGE